MVAATGADCYHVPACYDPRQVFLRSGRGAFKGKAWHIGLTGKSATERHVPALVSAPKSILG